MSRYKLFGICKKSLLVILLALAAILILNDDGWTRAGGGESYSSSSSSSGSSSGGSSYSSDGGSSSGDYEAIAELLFLIIRLLFWLCSEHPIIGFPLTIMLIAGIIWFGAKVMNGDTGSDDSSTDAGDGFFPQPGVLSSAQLALRLAGDDPNFSAPLFLDFVSNFYTRVQRERTGDLAGLSCYIRPELRRALCQQTEADGIEAVEDVVIGSITIAACEIGQIQKVTLDIEANLCEIKGRQRAAKYLKERWILTRNRGVLSQEPKQIMLMHCPSCGSTGETTSDGHCQQCDSLVSDGAFAWTLSAVKLIIKTDRPPLELAPVSYSEQIEPGTENPTIVDSNFEEERALFCQRHPGFVWKQFQDKAIFIFNNIQQAWSRNDAEGLRPFETDHVFQGHRYWLERYRKQGLVNCVEKVTIKRTEPVKVSTDAFYDAITLRIFASCLDYVKEEKSGKVISGSDEYTRYFSEYWTFIRAKGFEDGQHKHTDPQTCPSCGAPLNVGMSGICPYCDSKITTGEFDWVLSLIEQDDSYQG